MPIEVSNLTSAKAMKVLRELEVPKLATWPYDRCHYHVPPGHTGVTVESGHIRVKVVRAY